MTDTDSAARPASTLAFEWGDPPTSPRGGPKLSKRLESEGVLDALRGNPGQTAKVLTYGSDSGASAGAKALRKQLGDEFKVVVSGASLYITYVAGNGNGAANGAVDENLDALTGVV